MMIVVGETTIGVKRADGVRPSSTVADPRRSPGLAMSRYAKPGEGGDLRGSVLAGQDGAPGGYDRGLGADQVGDHFAPIVREPRFLG